MKILQFLEKAWIFAGIGALIVALYNLIAYRAFDYRVYFPILCSMFCLLIWFNVRGQRKFRDKIFGENQDKGNKGPTEPTERS